MGALPRPVTPGPWPEDYVSDAVRHINRNCDFIESATDPDFYWDRHGDAAAIAALPERIAREDRVRAYCDLLLEGAQKYGSHEMVTGDYAARRILRILDGEDGRV